MRPVWLEIDLSAIAHNLSEIKRVIPSSAKIMAVVKANGYGHGAAAVSRAALENGASSLGVATLGEALQLREMGFTVPILILGYTPPRHAPILVFRRISQTIFNGEQAAALSGAAAALSGKAFVHVKVDTGMGRLGFPPTEDSLAEIASIFSLPNLVVEGIFTHFAAADAADKTHALGQWSRFKEFVGRLERAGMHIPLRHAANSAAIISLPETHLDMVRPGIMLYGQYPSPETDQGRVSLKPAIALKAEVAHVKEVEAGTGLSYGSTYITTRKQRIATLPIGYADGFSRLFSNRGAALIHGRKAPVVGRVCMDQCLLDVTGVEPEVKAGDVAVLLGRQGDAEITADDWARLLSTINYEVVTGFRSRIPKIYK